MPVPGVRSFPVFTKAKAAAADNERGKKGRAHDTLHELMSLEVSLA